MDIALHFLGATENVTGSRFLRKGLATVIFTARQRLDAAGIDQDKGVLLPGHFRIMTISGNTGSGIDDRLPLSGQPVEQGRFPDVGSSH